jgi:hypothetical protein
MVNPLLLLLLLLLLPLEEWLLAVLPCCHAADGFARWQLQQQLAWPASCWWCCCITCYCLCASAVLCFRVNAAAAAAVWFYGMADQSSSTSS